jgi:hypothetical protein
MGYAILTFVIVALFIALLMCASDWYDEKEKAEKYKKRWESETDELCTSRTRIYNLRDAYNQLSDEYGRECRARVLLKEKFDLLQQVKEAKETLVTQYRADFHLLCDKNEKLCKRIKSLNKKLKEI